MSGTVGHGSVHRNALARLRMPAAQNPFVRFFDQDGPAHGLTELVALQNMPAPAAPMLEDPAAPADSTTPAGFTFLGQFIDHDITLTVPRQDPAPPLDQISSRHQFFNARTSDLELDSVFGFGPEHDLDGGGALYLSDFSLKTGPDTGNAPWDLARDGNGVALIGDPRNDENVILAQIHASFVHAYNRMRADAQGSRSERYIEARMRLYHTYQYIVVNDYLRRFVPAPVLDDVLARRAPLYTAMMARQPHAFPLMPIEFAVAAFRFGHSQVRPGYRLNLGPGSGAATFPVPDANGNLPAGEGLNGGRPIPDNLAFNPALFFSDQAPLPAEVQRARKIDTKLSEPLFFLRPPGIPEADRGIAPNGNQQLAKRNLLRGRQFRVVDAQTAAGLAGAPVLTPAQIGGGPAAPFGSSTPLWFYILREAELGGGETLGALGGRLVAETLVGILHHSASSYLRLKPAGWTPPEGLTTMAALMAYADLPRPPGT